MVIINNLRDQMIAYYVIYYEKFRKVMKQTHLGSFKYGKYNFIGPFMT